MVGRQLEKILGNLDSILRNKMTYLHFKIERKYLYIIVVMDIIYPITCTKFCPNLFFRKVIVIYSHHTTWLSVLKLQYDWKTIVIN